MSPFLHYLVSLALLSGGYLLGRADQMRRQHKVRVWRNGALREKEN